VLRKNYCVRESVSIATGFLIAALHRAGLVMLTHSRRAQKHRRMVFTSVGKPLTKGALSGVAKLKCRPVLVFV
jgi:hypothetical protein